MSPCFFFVIFYVFVRSNKDWNYHCRPTKLYVILLVFSINIDYT